MDKDPWKYRRRFMTSICAFCAISIWAVILMGTDAKVAEVTITMAFGILGTSLTSYVFGAVWDDKGKSDVRKP